MVLVFVVTLVWSVLDFLDQATSEKSAEPEDDRHRALADSQPHAVLLRPDAHRRAPAQPGRHAGRRARLDDLAVLRRHARSEESHAREQPVRDRHGPEKAHDHDGRSRFAAAGQGGRSSRRSSRNSRPTSRESCSAKSGSGRIQKRVGERIKIYSINYREIDLEFEIVGLFPDGRYDLSAAFNRQYLNDAMDRYPATQGGKQHPMMTREPEPGVAAGRRSRFVSKRSATRSRSRRSIPIRP